MSVRLKGPTQSHVIQDGWLGFRSAAAKGRLLQARRKGSSRLAFFSSNFGIWEQWKVVDGDISQPWSRQSLSFTSRNLPQVIIPSVKYCSKPPVELSDAHLYGSSVRRSS